MAQEVRIAGATYSDVPSISVPDSNNVYHSFVDTSPTTATDSDVASGKIYFKADGSQSTGTASGGGGGAISVVDTTDTAGGIIRTITAVDISDTTATASDVASGKYFYTSAGVKTEGTASGGGGGVSGIAKGTFAVVSDVSSGNVKITDTNEIGFVPTKFCFYRNEATTTGNRTHMAAYGNWDSQDLRVRAYYDAQSAILKSNSNATPWTTLTNGHLYFNPSTGEIFDYTTSTMILAAGTYTWIAVE